VIRWKCFKRYKRFINGGWPLESIVWDHVLLTATSIELVFAKQLKDHVLLAPPFIVHSR